MFPFSKQIPALGASSTQPEHSPVASEQTPLRRRVQEVQFTYLSNTPKVDSKGQPVSKRL